MGMKQGIKFTVYRNNTRTIKTCHSTFELATAIRNAFNSAGRDKSVEYFQMSIELPDGLRLELT